MNEDKKQLDELVKLAKKGSTDAFGKLYELHFLAIFSYIFRRIQHKELAEDLAEDVFVKAWKSFAGLSKPEAFVGWLYKITRNTLFDHYRSKANANTVDIDIDVLHLVATSAPLPDVELDNQINSEKLINLINQLPTTYQTVIELKFFQNLSAAEIGAILHKRPGAVRILQMRAMARLKELLQNK